jgi:signal transduction histidine kinase
VFSEKGAPLKKEVEVLVLLKKIVSLEQDGNGIKFDFKVPENLRPVEADEIQISRAIRNLLINAREAMSNSGRLTISVEAVTLRDRDRIALKPGDYIKISVRDTGVGIPAENIPKIFDPYFTTKDSEPRKGTGLGLAIAYSIVTGHDGIITADSEVGKGSVFSIYLPASKQAAL